MVGFAHLMEKKLLVSFSKQEKKREGYFTNENILEHTETL
jgi:hypothetical protein